MMELSIGCLGESNTSSGNVTRCAFSLEKWTCWMGSKMEDPCGPLSRRGGRPIIGVLGPRAGATPNAGPAMTLSPMNSQEFGKTHSEDGVWQRGCPPLWADRRNPSAGSRAALHSGEALLVVVPERRTLPRSAQIFRLRRRLGCQRTRAVRRRHPGPVWGWTTCIPVGASPACIPTPSRSATWHTTASLPGTQLLT